MKGGNWIVDNIQHYRSNNEIHSQVWGHLP